MPPHTTSENFLRLAALPVELSNEKLSDKRALASKIMIRPQVEKEVEKYPDMCSMRSDGPLTHWPVFTGFSKKVGLRSDVYLRR